ncbi:helix-turn-helix transcriptional regulator [Catellatospora coxensis]
MDGWTLDLATTQEAARSPVTAVRDLIAADPARRWRLEAAAGHAGCSPRTLQRTLAEQGTGFRELLSATRLGLARGLVQRTDLGLAEIAAACGFTDHAHLTRCFTARHGRPRRPSAATESNQVLSLGRPIDVSGSQWAPIPWRQAR